MLFLRFEWIFILWIILTMDLFDGIQSNAHPEAVAQPTPEPKPMMSIVNSVVKFFKRTNRRNNYAEASSSSDRNSLTRRSSSSGIPILPAPQTPEVSTKSKINRKEWFNTANEARDELCNRNTVRKIKTNIASAK